MSSTSITQKKFNADYYLTDKEFMRLMRIFALKLNKGNAFEADDLLQDTAVLIKSKFHLYKPENGAPFFVWARKVMQNQFINKYRRKLHTDSFIHSYDADTGEFYKDNFPDHYLSPREILENKEKMESINEIKNIINNSNILSNISKQAIMLRMDGLSIKEVGKKLNMTTASASSHIYTRFKKVDNLELIKHIFYEHYE